MYNRPYWEVDEWTADQLLSILEIINLDVKFHKIYPDE